MSSKIDFFVGEVLSKLLFPPPLQFPRQRDSKPKEAFWRQTILAKGKVNFKLIENH